MKLLGIILLIILMFVVPFIARNTWGLRFLDDIKQDAPMFLADNGFKVIGCQGYTTYVFYGTAIVYYTVEKDGNLYECAVMKRNNNYHLYNLEVKSPVNISM